VTAPPEGPVRRRVSRVEIVPGPGWHLVAALTACSVGYAGLLGAERAGLSPVVGFLGGAVAGGLAVLALPSVPTRVATAVILGLGGIVVSRHAALGATDVRQIGAWVVLTVLALLALARVDHDDLTPARGAPPSPSLASDVGVHAVVVLVAVAILAAALAPVVSQAMRRRAQTGDSPTAQGYADAPGSLRVNDTLDMSTRPRLSSRVVFRVAAARPDFWRAETFDAWDGTSWSHSDRTAFPVQRNMRGGVIVPEAGAVGPGATTLDQTFHFEEVSEVVFAAPTAAQIETDHNLVQRPDGTVIAAEPFGTGATYTVRSIRVEATADRLRSSDATPVPANIASHYSLPLPTSRRVAALARRATAGANTTYDRVLALEGWLGRHVQYSLDAPPSPRGGDAVDTFLFHTRVGWCQQVSSSLAVMLRSLGVPARVAVGFVPGEFDRLSGEYVVRERDAHQWVEVYFPGLGWQGFDPTASVPLAGESKAPTTTSDWLRGHLLLVLALAAVIVVSTVGFHVARGAAERRRTERARLWCDRQLERLERVGAAAGRPREPWETSREYGVVLAGVMADPRAARVGDLLDVDAFSATGLDAETRAFVEMTLESLATADMVAARP
jgi:transglutaminase-like putative cysteine protease